MLYRCPGGGGDIFNEIGVAVVFSFSSFFSGGAFWEICSRGRTGFTTATNESRVRKEDRTAQR